jgi:hypothetical protein
MKQRSFAPGRWIMGAAVAAALILAVGATHAAPPAAGTAAAAAVTLEYKMPTGQVLRYESREDSRQIMDVMGQVVETTSVSTSKFSFQGKGRQDKDFILAVTIDDITASVNTMQGDMSPDMKPVIGKGFDMVLSPLGIEIDVSGAKALTYSSPDGVRNLSAGFKVFFPDLPGKRVNVGDSWPSRYAIEEQSDSLDLRIDIDSVNTLEGFEKIDGMDCARISSKLSGVISGTGSQQGMDLHFSGKLTGTDTWYFAVKEGLYIKSKGESSSDIAIEAAGMTIPMTQSQTTEVKFVGR